MVVDRGGRLVGLVWGEFSSAGEGGAGYRALLTPAPAIIALVKFAFAEDGVTYSGP